MDAVGVLHAADLVGGAVHGGREGVRDHGAGDVEVEGVEDGREEEAAEGFLGCGEGGGVFELATEGGVGDGGEDLVGDERHAAVVIIVGY